MLRSSGAVERVAHRGSPRERTENTLPGFLLALQQGADAIELDVHVTADGVVIVHHDEAVQGVQIAGAPWERLSPMEVGKGARIPTLEDVLVAVGERATVYIELKGRGVGEPAIAVARRYGRRFAVHSFDHDSVAAAARLAPEVPRGVLLDRDVQNAVGVMRAAAQRVRPRDVWPHWSLVDARLMDAANQLELRVIPWTVNSVETARRLVGLGVAALCTDDVRLLDLR